MNTRTKGFHLEHLGQDSYPFILYVSSKPCSLHLKKIAFDITIKYVYTTLGIIFSKRQWILPYFFLRLQLTLCITKNISHPQQNQSDGESKVPNKGRRD